MKGYIEVNKPYQRSITLDSSGGINEFACIVVRASTTMIALVTVIIVMLLMTID